jgi:hypothetical protein
LLSCKKAMSSVFSFLFLLWHSELSILLVVNFTNHSVFRDKLPYLRTYPDNPYL